MVMELEWKVGAVFSYVVLMLLSFVGVNQFFSEAHLVVSIKIVCPQKNKK